MNTDYSAIKPQAMPLLEIFACNKTIEHTLTDNGLIVDRSNIATDKTTISYSLTHTGYIVLNLLIELFELDNTIGNRQTFARLLNEATQCMAYDDVKNDAEKIWNYMTNVSYSDLRTATIYISTILVYETDEENGKIASCIARIEPAVQTIEFVDPRVLLNTDAYKYIADALATAEKAINHTSK
jgi:hypothetical protein